MNSSSVLKSLSEKINDPRILTNPEEFLGPNWKRLLDFLSYIDTLSYAEIYEINERVKLNTNFLDYLISFCNSIWILFQYYDLDEKAITKLENSLIVANDISYDAFDNIMRRLMKKCIVFIEIVKILSFKDFPFAFTFPATFELMAHPMLVENGKIIRFLPLINTKDKVFYQGR
jgi:hypothetical protein